MTRRAIVFDLDETLYRERRFALGGYRAVARSVRSDFGIDERAAFAMLAWSLRRGRRSRAFQDLSEHFDLPASSIPSWVGTYRTHEPRLRLPRSARRALASLAGSWRLGVLTNGLPEVQASKVRALGIDRIVDAVVYADAYGGGKPCPAAFLEVLDRLGAEPRQSVFAGDDPVRDIEGAKSVGMKTILVSRGGPGAGGPRSAPDAVIVSLAEIGSVAERLVGVEGLHVH